MTHTGQGAAVPAAAVVQLRHVVQHVAHATQGVAHAIVPAVQWFKARGEWRVLLLLLLRHYHMAPYENMRSRANTPGSA